MLSATMLPQSKPIAETCVMTRDAMVVKPIVCHESLDSLEEGDMMRLQCYRFDCRARPRVGGEQQTFEECENGSNEAKGGTEVENRGETTGRGI